MKSVIRKMGNSHGVFIPKKLLTAIGATVGDQVALTVSGGKIVIALSRNTTRSGWAADSKRLVAAGEGGLVWTEIANDGDQYLEW
jgi:antitoxin MazE